MRNLKRIATNLQNYSIPLGVHSNIREANATNSIYMTFGNTLKIRISDHDKVYAGAHLSIRGTKTEIVEAKRLIELVAAGDPQEEIEAMDDWEQGQVEMQKVFGTERRTRGEIEEDRSERLVKIERHGGVVKIKASIARLQAILNVPSHKGGPSGNKRRSYKCSQRDLMTLLVKC